MARTEPEGTPAARFDITNPEHELSCWCGDEVTNQPLCKKHRAIVLHINREIAETGGVNIDHTWKAENPSPKEWE